MFKLLAGLVLVILICGVAFYLVNYRRPFGNGSGKYHRPIAVRLHEDRTDGFIDELIAKMGRNPPLSNFFIIIFGLGSTTIALSLGFFTTDSEKVSTPFEVTEKHLNWRIILSVLAASLILAVVPTLEVAKMARDSRREYINANANPPLAMWLLAHWHKRRKAIWWCIGIAWPLAALIFFFM